ncbi:DUF309 domain-containing protein [Cohnella fermenti]|uniref:DUF309 domain-containing protein n=1 Tax=Cohnella fermenti TaxID=2565925 RepID=UPI001454CAC1|nr:DUF309 domain-containing protein [Cohnella fermenti]
MKQPVYPEPLIDYLAEYYGSRDFFECHEIMEHYWKEEKGSPLEGSWLVLIRIAVLQYHARRGNRAGAAKLLRKAVREIDPARMDEIGFDGARLKAELEALERRWNREDDIAYAELELPIRSPSLLRLAQERCAAQGWTWGTPLERLNDGIVNRHLLRDRTEVIEERENAARSKAELRDRTNEEKGTSSQ